MMLQAASRDLCFHICGVGIFYGVNNYLVYLSIEIKSTLACREHVVLSHTIGLYLMRVIVSYQDYGRSQGTQIGLAIS